jgi:hypothetical protein
VEVSVYHPHSYAPHTRLCRTRNQSGNRDKSNLGQLELDVNLKYRHTGRKLH